MKHRSNKALKNTTNKPKRTLIKWTIIALVLSLVAVGVVLGNQAYLSQQTCSNNSVTYQDAADAINQNNINNLKAISEKIEEDESSNTSVGCLAVAVMIDLTLGNSVAAENRFKKLEKISTDETKLPRAFQSLSVNNVGDIKKQINTAVEVRNESYENTLLF